MTGTSPAGPLMCGSTTPRTRPAATAASKALPPFSRTAIPAAEASQWVDATMPNVPASCGRVVKLDPCGIMRTPRAGSARWGFTRYLRTLRPPARGAPPAVTKGRPDRLAPRPGLPHPAHDREQAEMRALAVPHRIAVAALIGAAALLAACTSASQTAGGSTPAAQSAAPAASASTSAAAPSSPAPATSGSSSSSGGGGAVTTCATSALKGAVNTAAAGAAAGSIYYPLDLTNTSGGTCTVFGYPGVSFVTGPSGTLLGRAASRNPAKPAATVTLAPGQVAHATLQVAQAGNYDPAQCKPVTAHWLRIYPPDQTVPLYVRFKAQACSARLPHSVGSQLSVTVFQSGAS